LPENDLWARVRGTNHTMSRLRSAGYTYVHFENEYDYLTQCGPEEPRCVRGNLGLDEFDVALLSNTPIIDLMMHRRQRRRSPGAAWTSWRRS
jgi:hypothetical protein